MRNIFGALHDTLGLDDILKFQNQNRTEIGLSFQTFVIFFSFLFLEE